MQTNQQDTEKKVKPVMLDTRFASLIKRIMQVDDGVTQIVIVKENGEIKVNFSRLGSIERIG